MSGIGAQVPHIGDRVWSMDGFLVGRVDAIRSGAFRTVRDDISLWLRNDAMFTDEGERLTLVCNLRAVPRYLAPRDVNEPVTTEALPD